MVITEFYSHFGGLEHILCHSPYVWSELQASILAADSPRVARGPGDDAGSAPAWNALAIALERELTERGWNVQRRPSAQSASRAARRTRDFVTNRVWTQLQLGTRLDAAERFAAMSQVLYQRDAIDVAVGVLPMRQEQAGLTADTATYQSVRSDLLSLGRSALPVPLVLVGIGVSSPAA